MSIEPHLLKSLPAASRLKIETLIDDRAAAHAALMNANDNLHALIDDYELQEGRTRQRIAESVQSRAVDGFGPPRKSAAIFAPVDWSAYLDALQKDQAAWSSVVWGWRREKLPKIVSAKTSLTRHEEKWSSFTFLSGVEDWLRRAARDGASLKAAPPVAPPKGEPRKVVDGLRRELGKLEKVWADTESAPLPVSELKQRTIEAVETIAERGRPTFDPKRRESDPFAIEDALKIEYAGELQRVLPQVIGDGGASLLVWLCRDQLEQRLVGMLPPNDLPGSLSDERREERIAEINARRLDIERQEEAAIMSAADDGMTIIRRRDADPRAILEVIG
jgi:hypothetical protein